MLDETEPLLEYKVNRDENNKEKCNTCFFRAVYNYIQQPKFWDWIIVCVIIASIIATIIICT